MNGERITMWRLMMASAAILPAVFGACISLPERPMHRVTQATYYEDGITTRTLNHYVGPSVVWPPLVETEVTSSGLRMRVAGDAQAARATWAGVAKQGIAFVVGIFTGKGAWP